MKLNIKILRCSRWLVSEFAGDWRYFTIYRRAGHPIDMLDTAEDRDMLAVNSQINEKVFQSRETVIASHISL